MRYIKELFICEYDSDLSGDYLVPAHGCLTPAEFARQLYPPSGPLPDWLKETIKPYSNEQEYPKEGEPQT